MGLKQVNETLNLYVRPQTFPPDSGLKESFLSKSVILQAKTAPRWRWAVKK